MVRILRTGAVCCALLGVFLLSLSSAASAQDATPIDNGNSSESAPVTANDVETRSINLGVTMADDGPIPAGLIWTLNGPTGVYATGSVDSGITSWLVNLPAVPEGDYSYWVTGTYYSIGVSLPWAWLSGDIVFDVTRAAGPLTFMLDTSDGNDVPAGSGWSLTNSSNVEVESGILPSDAPDGTTITTSYSYDYGDYTLAIIADGYNAYSAPVTINANPTTATANLVSSVPQYSDVTLTLTTSDASTIPAGTTWSFAGQSGTIETATASGLVIALDPVLYGTYTLNLATPANAFTYTDNAVVIDTATRDLGINIVKQYSSVTLNLTSWDNSDIPAGTTWALVGTDKAGTISTDTPVGGPVIDLGTVEYGRYALLVRTRADIFYYYAIVDILQNPLELNVTLSDTSVPEDHTSIVSLTIEVDDGTNIPAGTTWSLTRADDPDYTPIARGAVPPMSASPYTVTMPDPVQWGQYVFFVNSPALVYYQSYVVNIIQDNYDYTIYLEHRQGDVTATVSTSDGSNIPDGTTWSITDADDTVIQSGTISGASGTALPIANPYDYGTYTLTMTDPSGAYLPFVQGFIVNQPATSLDFTLTTVPPVAGDVELTIATSDGAPVPTGTIITIGGVTMLVTENGVTAADIASGTVVSFTDVPEGEQSILVTNAAPYNNYSGSVEIIAGSSIDAAITLVRTQEPEVPTPTPTEPSIPEAPTPTATAPFNPQNPVLPGRTPVPGDSQTGDGTSGGGSGTTGGGVTTLPSTGQQPAGSETTPWVLLGVVTMLALVALGAAHRLRRR